MAKERGLKFVFGTNNVDADFGKLEYCIEAIEKGVRRVTILDGRVPHALLLELLTDEGAGTLVKGMD